ncbi:MAG TPA: cytidylate kinase-like family protein, partial [Verrucomicrobiota bacterium]|nr:cytidylate kinase-like family protein [Verrucomicrobiota bacterium]
QAGCRWAVFDRNLVETVLRDHHYSERIAGFMPERQRSAIQDAVEELLGLHPSSWTLVEKTSETILHLAEAGHAIIVGRGANVIIGFRPGAYHVRLVGSVEKRLENLQEYYQFSPRKAREYLQRTDRGRRWYLKKQFGKNIEDPLLYHLVLNMDAISIEQAAEIIGEAALRSQEGD